MVIDISSIIRGGTRLISSREFEGKPARILTINRPYATTQEDLWDALTNLSRIPKWFLPVTGDLEVGGKYQFENNASGEVISCKPPEAFSITWEMGGQVSWVNVSLTPEGAQTILKLEHIAHVPDELWDQFGPGAVGIGWDLGLLGLYRHLETGQSSDPAQAYVWMVSPEGKEFISQSSEAWADASIADGTPADTAKTAAVNVTAFYMGDSCLNQ